MIIELSPLNELLANAVNVGRAVEEMVGNRTRFPLEWAPDRGHCDHLQAISTRFLRFRLFLIRSVTWWPPHSWLLPRASVYPDQKSRSRRTASTIPVITSLTAPLHPWLQVASSGDWQRAQAEQPQQMNKKLTDNCTVLNTPQVPCCAEIWS